VPALGGNASCSVMPALVAGIHVFLAYETQDVDGRDKPGHDDVVSHRYR
jgi:hypothetical protein